MLGVLLVSFICVYLLFRFIIFLFQHAKKRKYFSIFPQLPSNFLLGHAFLFFKHRPISYHLLRLLNQMADHFVHKDKIFLAWGFVFPAVIMFNKNYVKQILSKNSVDFLNKAELGYKALEDIGPCNLLTVSGEKWKIRRKILSVPLHSMNLDNFVRIINFELLKLANFLKKNRCQDTLHEMRKFALLTNCKILFEYDIDDDIEEMVKLANSTVDIATRKGTSIFVLSPALYQFTSIAAEESKTFKGMVHFKNKMLNAKIDSSRQSLKSKLDSQNDELDGKSSNLTLIEILLKNFNKNIIKEKTAEWSGFDMDEIGVQIDTFILTGVDTTSSGLFFLLYHLAKYPNYQQQIYEEVQQVFGDDIKRELTVEEVKQFVFLDAFINESLRIQPIIPIIARHVTKEVKLDEKYTIPANTDVSIFIEKLLLDPDYFPDPLVFRPERFLEDQKDNLYASIPFSGGPRNCVAKNFALNVMRFSAAHLVRNFKIEFAESTPRELTRSMLKYEGANKPIDKIELKFSARNSC